MRTFYIQPKLIIIDILEMTQAGFVDGIIFANINNCIIISHRGVFLNMSNI
jgi:hypothetical protein